MTRSAPPRCQSFVLPRAGHSADMCQDACAADADAGRFAVADGAGDSAFAGEWARLLAVSYVHGRSGPPAWGEWLGPLHDRWQDEVRPILDSLNEIERWPIDAKVARGAWSTFLGLRLWRGADGRLWEWEALAVGDTCLFQVRRGRLLRPTFPLVHPDEFGVTPNLIGTRPAQGDWPRPRALLRRGKGVAEDRLYLMTDALSQWFLRIALADGRPWDDLAAALADADPERAFADLVAGQRRAGRLRNDDVGLVTVCLE